ncbi:MAG: dTDP-4-dehydrorhamnose reductase [Nitrospirae bacterium]|nr:dTDP-4-dehydrorhamnose reductase [Nitrospirota bacterium]MBI5694995.1 dTDP-4-dehydrorhamnose reductase [Nitrospirota bacterium]
MKILVTGAAGMLGSDIVDRLKGRHEVVGVTRHDFDILDELMVRGYLLQEKPDWVIHSAAFTNVDGCEKEPDKAYRVNGEGPGSVARACWHVGARMAYVSTDYVYDGTKGEPYVETDPVAPLNVYGRSKLMGEAEVLKVLPDALIIRTSWLFGRRGPNFVEAILGQVGKRDELTVVDDQVGSPTYTPDLADGIVRLVESGAPGVVHLSNEGTCSWFDYANKIFELAGVTGISVKPITTEQLGRPAVRPKYSVLSKDRYFAVTGHRLRDWREALAEYIRQRG